MAQVPVVIVIIVIDMKRWGSKAMSDGEPGRERSLTMSSAVWIQYTNVTDGPTDDSKDRAYA